MMQKKSIPLLFFTCLLALDLAAQILQPAKWTTATPTHEVRVGQEIDLIFTAKIDKNWYLYSSEFDCEDGPIKTTFSFTPDPGYQLVGKLTAINPTDKHDKIFECDVKVFKGTGEFRQKVKILNSKVVIAGSYEYQVCTEVDGRCVPGDGEFSFSNLKVTGAAQEENQPKVNEQPKPQPEAADETISASKPAAESLGARKGPVLDKTILEGKSSLNEDSFLGYLIFAFVLGLTSLITPCVFPMIPMTVT